MPIWVNESKGGFEYVCMCDRCGVESPPASTDDDAVEGFHPIYEEGRDTIYHCPFCHVLLEEGPVQEDVAISRLVAVLQQQGSQLSFIPGTRAREMIDQLVHGLVRDQTITNNMTVSFDSDFNASMQSVYDHVAEAFTRNPLMGFSKLKKPAEGPFVELPPWAAPGALVARGGTLLRIKAVTPSEVVLSNGSQLVVWSRSQQPMDQEFEPAVPLTRTDFLLEVEEE